VVLIFLDLIVFWRLVDGFGVIKSSSDDIVCKSKKNI
jgi:endo-beta-N-acetylglucosaminidase D